MAKKFLALLLACLLVGAGFLLTLTPTHKEHRADDGTCQLMVYSSSFHALLGWCDNPHHPHKGNNLDVAHYEIVARCPSDLVGVVDYSRGWNNVIVCEGAHFR